MIEMSLVCGEGETDGRAEKGMDPENGMYGSTQPSINYLFLES